jgi:hypothetical protein
MRKGGDVTKQKVGDTVSFLDSIALLKGCLMKGKLQKFGRFLTQFRCWPKISCKYKNQQ